MAQRGRANQDKARQSAAGRGKGSHKRLRALGVALVVLAAAALFALRWRAAPAAETPPPESPAPAASAGPAGARTQDWRLLVVSAAAPLSRSFRVDLEQMGDYRVDTRIAQDLRAMLAGAQADGVELIVCSGFRNVSEQTGLYNDRVSRYRAQGLDEAAAKEQVGRSIQPPGCSEHHTGLALDIVTPYHQTLDEAFDQTAACQWLKDHAARYGFVLRYPRDKQDVTGIDYEPWHYRYVGVEAAAAMAEGDLCLEEYVAGGAAG